MQLSGMSKYNAMAQYIDEMREQTEGGIKGVAAAIATGDSKSHRITATMKPETAKQFQAAVKELQAYDEKYERTMEEQVKLHALFCQATCGDCNQDKPDFFDAEAGSKWHAWRALAGLPKQKAALQYIQESKRQRLPMSKR